VTQPPLYPDEVVSTSGERDVLEAFLDVYRKIVVRKASGLSEEDVRRRFVPSDTTLAGLLSHLAAVERNWFHHHLGQTPREELPGNAKGDPSTWDVGPERTIADLVAEYEAACQRSREIAAQHGLDDAVPHPRLGRVSLRWIYVHMIEETARHAGHADIIRELTDGATGVDG
jgi:hypothetical protein